MKHYQSTPTRWIIISQLLVRCLKLQSLHESSSSVLFSLVFCEFCGDSEIIFSTKHTFKSHAARPYKMWMNEWLTLFAAIIMTTFRDYIYYHVMPEDSRLNLLYLFGSCLIGIHL